MLADFGVRAAASRLPVLNDWNDWEATHKVAAMEALVAKRGGASVVAVGSSTTNADVDPALLTTLLGGRRPAFNAALNGSAARLMELWTLHVVVPILKPRTVVVGLSSRELNDLGAAGIESYEKVRRSPGGRRVAPDLSPTERLNGLAERFSYLVRYRTRLRHPSTLRRTETEGAGARVGPLGTLRALSRFNNATYAVTDRFRTQIAPESFARFAVGGRETDALVRLLRGLRDAGVQTVVVKTPVTNDLYGFHPQGRADYARFEEVLGRVVAAERPRFIDMTTAFAGTQDFADPYHLNGTGRRKFTELLASGLRTG